MSDHHVADASIATGPGGGDGKEEGFDSEGIILQPVLGDLPLLCERCDLGHAFCANAGQCLPTLV